VLLLVLGRNRRRSWSRSTDEEIKSAKNKVGDEGRWQRWCGVAWRKPRRRPCEVGAELGVGGGGDVRWRRRMEVSDGMGVSGGLGRFLGSGVDKAGIGYRCPPVCLIGSPRPDSLGCNPRPIPRW
jgi:hypothetical protein